MRKRDKLAEGIINIASATDPVNGEVVLTFDAPWLPERIIADTYVPPFVGVVYVKRKVATRNVHATDGVGSCKCSECGWRIDPCDLYCRRCGAKLTATAYKQGGEG